MRRMRPAVILAFVLLLSVAGAGCGGDSKEEFEQAVIAARDRTDGALAQVTQPTSAEDLVARLRIARDEVATASAEVGTAEAPDSLVDERRRLAASLSALSSELDGTADTLETIGGGAASIRTLDFPAWNRVQDTLTALRSEGVEVEPLRRH